MLDSLDYFVLILTWKSYVRFLLAREIDNALPLRMGAGDRGKRRNFIVHIGL